MNSQPRSHALVMSRPAALATSGIASFQSPAGDTTVRTLDEVYSSLSTRRRYEVWFVRLGLADGSGAWWFRYLLMNPGRSRCAGNLQAMPVQVWATWFPRDGKPQSFIQEFRLEALDISNAGLSLSDWKYPPSGFLRLIWERNQRNQSKTCF